MIIHFFAVIFCIFASFCATMRLADSEVRIQPFVGLSYGLFENKCLILLLKLRPKLTWLGLYLLF